MSSGRQLTLGKAGVPVCMAAPWICFLTVFIYVYEGFICASHAYLVPKEEPEEGTGVGCEPSRGPRREVCKCYIGKYLAFNRNAWGCCMTSLERLLVTGFASLSFIHSSLSAVGHVSAYFVLTWPSTAGQLMHEAQK